MLCIMRKNTFHYVHLAPRSEKASFVSRLVAREGAPGLGLVLSCEDVLVINSEGVGEYALRVVKLVIFSVVEQCAMAEAIRIQPRIGNVTCNVDGDGLRARRAGDVNCFVGLTVVFCEDGFIGTARSLPEQHDPAPF